jgi:hypothetical protein
MSQTLLINFINRLGDKLQLAAVSNSIRKYARSANRSNKNGPPGCRRISRLREFGDKDPCNTSVPRFPFTDKISSACNLCSGREKDNVLQTPKQIYRLGIESFMIVLTSPLFPHRSSPRLLWREAIVSPS